MNTTECPNDLCRHHHDCSNECYECGALTVTNEAISTLKDWLSCADTPDEWVRCRDRAKDVIERFSAPPEENVK